MKVRSGPNFGLDVRVRDDVWAGNCRIMRNRVMMKVTGEGSLVSPTAGE